MNPERKPIFFTSDWHLGHENCIKYDGRPFESLSHMHRVLVNNYNSTVPENGICYFLGDIGLAKGDLVKNILRELNGTKVCVLGNHDKGMNSYYTAGFDVVMNGGKIVVGGKYVLTFSHCPLVGVWREDTSQMKRHVPGEHWHREKDFGDFYSWPDMGQFHLHGHVHSDKGETILGRQMDVGVPGNDYRPVALSKIEGWIGTYGK